jgi:hypothetical protein
MPWPGLTRPVFESIAGEMLRRLFAPEDVSKVGGGNFCRVFVQVTAAQSSP